MYCISADRQRQIADDAMKKETAHLDILQRKLHDTKMQNEAYRRALEEDMKRMEEQAEEINRKFLKEKLVLETRVNSTFVPIFAW